MSSHGGVKKGLFENAGEGRDLAQQYDSQALGINSALAPTLTAEAINPQGFNPTTMGQMQTAAEQTAGGTNAGIAGTAGLRAARTRNVGSGQAATAESGRGAAEDLSQINSGIQSKNADLKARQQSQGLSGLGEMYRTDVGAGEGALGLSNQALGTAGNLSNFWQEYILNGQKAAASAAAGAGG